MKGEKIQAQSILPPSFTTTLKFGLAGRAFTIILLIFERKSYLRKNSVDIRKDKLFKSNIYKKCENIKQNFMVSINQSNCSNPFVTYPENRKVQLKSNRIFYLMNWKRGKIS